MLYAISSVSSFKTPGRIDLNRCGKSTIMKTYRCSMRHIYNPSTGDADIPPGTAFENLSDDWRCPVCLAEKSKFSPFDSPLARLGL